jgi:hypothetical protein
MALKPEAAWIKVRLAQSSMLLPGFAQVEGIVGLVIGCDRDTAQLPGPGPASTYY